MKAKLIRSDLDVAPSAYAFYGDDFVRDNTAPSPLAQWIGDRPLRRWKWGTVIENPIAWQYVRQGIAIPADEECAAKAGLTPAQMEAAQKHYETLMEDGSYIEEIVSRANRPQIIDEDEE